jgi:hypothetical protein
MGEQKIHQWPELATIGPSKANEVLWKICRLREVRDGLIDQAIASGETKGLVVALIEIRKLEKALEQEC